MYLKIFLFFTIFVHSLYSAEFQHVVADFSEENEIKILKTLDIDSNFIGDITYENMKTSIKEIDILYFARTLKSGQIIIETLKNMIAKTDIPDTFLYMAMIESKFLTTARSNKSAAGLWQLMPKTAKHLNLTINSKIDERLDPIKSTEVAIEYLQYLHSRFNKWYLVAIAYNCGETRLAKAIKKSGSDDILVLLDEDTSYLPKETKLYIRRLIIAALISHSDTILLEEQLIESEGNSTTLKPLKVKKGTSLKKIASSYDIPVKSLKQYNAHILKGVTPKGKKRYCIYIPKDKINQKMSICSINKNIFTYTVKEGDSLSLISKHFNIKISEIKELNKDLTAILPVGKKIALIGQDTRNLKIKDIKFAPKAPRKETTKLSFSEDGIVEKIITNIDDTTQNTNKTQLYDKNKSKTTKIKKFTNKDDTFSYKVKQGDTLFLISKKFNNSVSTLTKLNGNLSEILDVGRTLIIKR